MQETNFNCEIVIGEDCSTDNTRAIILEYKYMFPEKITLLLHNKNIGAMQNQIQTLKACKGKYIALLEGDDYWTDPYKLQKQVDFLEANEDYSICVHNVENIFDGVPAFYPFSIHWVKDSFTFEDVLNNHFILTLSIVFRKQYIKNLPDWFRNCVSGDIPLELILSAHGNGKYLHEVMGVKRKNAGGITYNKDRKKFITFSFYEMYKNINEYTSHRYYDIIKPKLAKYERALAFQNFQKGNIFSGIKYIIKSLRRYPAQIVSYLSYSKLKDIYLKLKS